MNEIIKYDFSKKNKNVSSFSFKKFHLDKKTKLKKNDCRSIIQADWSNKRNGKSISPLHSVSSYLAMNTPSLSDWFINEYTKKNDVIYDPFCGRGTSILRAREMKRIAYGADLNPYAIVLSRLKVSIFEKKDVLISRVNILTKRFTRWYAFNKKKYRDNQYKELRIYYSAKVLSQLIFLKETLGKNWRNLNNIDNAIITFAFGLMHGQIKKDQTSIYFSLSMPNTISMSPNYVKKYAKKNKLKRPQRSIFKKIKNRIHKKYDSILEQKFSGKIFEMDANKINNNISDKSIDLVLTSPPYLSIVNYTNSNWLRLWLLGYDRQELKAKIILSDKLKFEDYIIFVKNFLNSLYPKLKKNAKVCLVVADVDGERLIQKVWNKIKKNVLYDLLAIYCDHKYTKNKKVLNKMNKKIGKKTVLEKILVIKKR